MLYHFPNEQRISTEEIGDVLALCVKHLLKHSKKAWQSIEAAAGPGANFLTRAWVSY